MKIPAYNKKGEKTTEVLLPKEIFEIPFNSDLVHQVAISLKSNKRRNIAHAKDRSEVSGGGRKPWRQKGTGRARHGSTRSPIWRGGGVTFGPQKKRNFSKIVPKQMRRKALFMVLSAKVKENLLIVLDFPGLDEIKTKSAYSILKSLPVKDNSGLFVLPKIDKKSVLSFRNIPKIETIEARNLNVLDLLSFKYLIMPKESIKVIKETFIKKG